MGDGRECGGNIGECTGAKKKEWEKEVQEEGGDQQADRLSSTEEWRQRKGGGRNREKEGKHKN